MNPGPRFTAFIILFSLLSAPIYAADDSLVKIIRVPEGGLQPQAVVDSRSRVHLIYFKGDPAHGEVFYVRSDNDGKMFTAPLRVNSQPGSVIAIGTVRGPHLALGKNDRVHVAWTGSGIAEPKPARNQPPMLYSRLSKTADAFEPQRNVIRDHPGLDGGGSIAADRNGNVYVAWHAPDVLGAGEANRHVWVARSKDDGQTFAAETDFTPGDRGACGCCGLRLFVSDRGGLFALYRSAAQLVHRDIYLIGSSDFGQSTTATKVGTWEIGACVMSTSALCAISDGGIAGAFEEQGNVVMFDVAAGQNIPQGVTAMGGEARNRKHPAIAVNRLGQRVVAWTEGTAWARGGRVVWQSFDEKNQPIDKGSADGLPAWDMPAVVATRDGRFLLLY
jgi:hypothetical protein